MISQQKLSPLLSALLLMAGVVLALTNCTPRTTSMRGGLTFLDTGIRGFLSGHDRREVHAKAEA